MDFEAAVSHVLNWLWSLHFGGKHHQNLCHPEIKDHRQILDVS